MRKEIFIATLVVTVKYVFSCLWRCWIAVKQTHFNIIVTIYGAGYYVRYICGSVELSNVGDSTEKLNTDHTHVMKTLRRGKSLEEWTLLFSLWHEQFSVLNNSCDNVSDWHDPYRHGGGQSVVRRTHLCRKSSSVTVSVCCKIKTQLFSAGLL